MFSLLETSQLPETGFPNLYPTGNVKNACERILKLLIPLKQYRKSCYMHTHMRIYTYVKRPECEATKPDGVTGTKQKM